MSSAPGWYPDPNDDHITRYWDGSRWSEERSWTGTQWVTGTAATGGLGQALPGIDLSRLALTPITLFAGVALAAIGVFLPWEQDTVGADFLGSAATTVTSGPTKVPVVAFVLVVILGGIAALCWPSVRSRLSKRRCIGVAGLTALLWVLPIGKAAALGDTTDSYMEYHLGLGWYLTILGLLALCTGCVLAFFGIGTGTRTDEVVR